MKVHYWVENEGELKVRDAQRMIVLHGTYWQTTHIGDYLKFASVCAIPVGAPTAEISNRLFEELYHGIRRYFRQGWSLPGSQGFDSPHIQRLKSHIESLEDHLLSHLKKDDQLDLTGYLSYKKLLD